MAFPQYSSGFVPQAAGPQMPERYPTSVGPNYRIFGEQKGWVYDPYSDRYRPDPKAQQQYLENIGAIDKAPEPPSAYEAILPLAGVVGGGALAKEIGEGIPGWLGFGEEAGKEGAKQTLSGLLGLGKATAPTIPTASLATTTLPAGAAIPAGYTAVGTAADGGLMIAPAASSAGGGLFSLGGIGSAGNAILPAAGAVGFYDLFANKREGVRGPLQGAASGAAMGSYFGPWGIGIGAGVGGLLGLAGGLGDKDMWKTEGNRLRDLQESGTNVPAGLLSLMPTKGRSTAELIDIAKQTGGNVTFAGSRKESDLTPTDIVNYATFAENDPTWFTKSLEDRLAFAQKALNAGAVREHHGTIDVDFSKLPAPATPQTLVPVPRLPWKPGDPVYGKGKR